MRRDGFRLRLIAAILFALSLGIALPGCDAGSRSGGFSPPGGGGSDVSAILGTWSGELQQTSTRKHGGLVHIMTIQFRPGSGGANTFRGTFQVSIPFPFLGLLPLYEGTIEGTFDPRTQQVSLTMVHFLDQNGNPAPEATERWTLSLTALQNSMNGRYDAPNMSGNVSLTRQTTGDNPNVDVSGNWAGDPGAGGGFQLVNPINNKDIGPRGPMTIAYQQTEFNRLTATISSPTPNAQQYTTTAQGSITGNLVLITGQLPAQAGSVTVQELTIPLAGKTFSYNAVVSQEGGRQIQKGKFRVRIADDDPLRFLIGVVGFDLKATAGYIEVGNFQIVKAPPAPPTGGINVPIR